MVRRDARILVHDDSTILEATDGALHLLGLSIEELRDLPSGALSVEDDRAASNGFSAAWSAAGRNPILGTGTLRRPDGRLIRVSYLISVRPEGGYEVILEPSDEAVGDPGRRYTVGEALSAWRVADQKLATVDVGTPEWDAVQKEIEYFRREYHRLARDRSGATEAEVEAHGA